MEVKTYLILAELNDLFLKRKNIKIIKIIK
jgi:hypothetical protein